MSKVIAHHATDMSTQWVANAQSVFRSGPIVGEVAVKLSRTLGYEPGVTDRREVAGESSYVFPVHRDYIVVPSSKVSWNRHRTYFLLCY